MSHATPRPLAVFDLDGTLVDRDTLLPFLIGYARRTRRLRPVLRMSLDLGRYALRRIDARTAKERVLSAFLAGEPVERIGEYAERFCRTWLPGHWVAGVVERLRLHQADGCRVILLSASPDPYVPAVGRALGVEEVVCTRVAVRDGVCLGRILGENCKGPAKVDALRRHLGGTPIPPGSFAYGDRPSDLPVLRLVEHGYLCRKGRILEVAGQGGETS